MRVVGFGDYLIHFSPFGEERFMQADMMRMSFTGAEANVCAALAFWGDDVEFVTCLPEHTLAKRGIAFLRSFGIHTEHIPYGGERMGVYYLEKGASLRPSSVIYDRNHSSFTKAVYHDYPWDVILDNAGLIYLSGITPALSENTLTCCTSLLQEAQKRKIPVAYDVNYRSALASPEVSGNILKTLAPYITYLIANEEHLKLLLGIVSVYGEDEYHKRLQNIAFQVKQTLSIPHIAITVRRTLSASDSIIYAAYASPEDFAVSPKHQIHVVDRVGSGDAFSAGFLHGIRHQWSVPQTVSFAAASNAVKHTIISDINFASEDEILQIMSNASLDVKR